MKAVNPHIFRAHGIRGLAGTDLDAEVAYRVGLAFAQFIDRRPVTVARDHRLSSPELTTALTDGLRRGGSSVCAVGQAPKGLAIFAANRLGHPLVYVSASHLPPEWNGFKFIRPDGCTMDEEACAQVRDLFWAGPRACSPYGSFRRADFREAYLSQLQASLEPAPVRLRLLVDCGNGTAALTAPELLARLGFAATSLFAEIDGRMPNRASELTLESLAPASSRMKEHDLGIAFDGDADRLAFLHPNGTPIDLERFAFIVLLRLARFPNGPIVANAACGNTIAELAARFRRPFYRVPVGAPHLVGTVMRVGAVLGMEASGHWIVPVVAPWDDAVAVAAYAAGALAEAISKGNGLDALLAQVPERPRLRLTLSVSDAQKKECLRALRTRLERDGYSLDTLDGLRVTTPEGWILFRASGTEPAVRIIAEAPSRAHLSALHERCRALLRDIGYSLDSV